MNFDAAVKQILVPIFCFTEFENNLRQKYFVFKMAYNLLPSMKRPLNKLPFINKQRKDKQF